MHAFATLFVLLSLLAILLIALPSSSATIKRPFSSTPLTFVPSVARKARSQALTLFRRNAAKGPDASRGCKVCGGLGAVACSVCTGSENKPIFVYTPPVTESINTMATVKVAPQVAEAWHRVLDDHVKTNWVIAGYEGGNTKEVVLKAEGEGGFDEFIEKLGEEIVWGGFRCTGVDNRGNLESRRAKFIFVGYLPKAAPVMKRARCGGHKAEVKKVFNSIHVEFQIEDVSEITKEEVITKLRLSGGAHQPTSYEF